MDVETGAPASTTPRPSGPPMAAPNVSPPVPPGPWATGLLQCPWCPHASYGEAPSLMRHLTNVHAGQPLDQELVDLLRALERGVCTARLCGGFRRVGARQCNRCGATTRLRPPAVGDVVQGPLGTVRQGANQFACDWEREGRRSRSSAACAAASLIVRALMRSAVPLGRRPVGIMRSESSCMCWHEPLIPLLKRSHWDSFHHILHCDLLMFSPRRPTRAVCLHWMLE